MMTEGTVPNSVATTAARTVAHRLAFILTIGVGMTASAAPLATPVEAQAPDEEASVLAVIDALFDAMRANDGEAVSAVFADGAYLIQTEAGDGSPRINFIPATDFASMVGNATQPLDEPYWDPVVQIHDHLAAVWVKYAFFLNEDLSHCGVDAFILARSPDGWKIASLADTRERVNCELPPGRQPHER
ncbi:MAG: nuclear transport factor 2 family protein [Gemmatimonadota bacterium]|nr:nuclear transport factor 2 family protein [Gemmatimonadota bacterium]